MKFAPGEQIIFVHFYPEQFTDKERYPQWQQVYEVSHYNQHGLVYVKGFEWTGWDEFDVAPANYIPLTLDTPEKIEAQRVIDEYYRKEYEINLALYCDFCVSMLHPDNKNNLEAHAQSERQKAWRDELSRRVQFREDLKKATGLRWASEYDSKSPKLSEYIKRNGHNSYIREFHPQRDAFDYYDTFRKEYEGSWMQDTSHNMFFNREPLFADGIAKYMEELKGQLKTFYYKPAKPAEKIKVEANLSCESVDKFWKAVSTPPIDPRVGQIYKHRDGDVYEIQHRDGKYAVMCIQSGTYVGVTYDGGWHKTVAGAFSKHDSYFTLVANTHQQFLEQGGKSNKGSNKPKKGSRVEKTQSFDIGDRFEHHAGNVYEIQNINGWCLVCVIHRNSSGLSKGDKYAEPLKIGQSAFELFGPNGRWASNFSWA